jgi:membrane peptidoglycan carboxypeptidase
MKSDEYDSRIAMVPGYRAPRPVHRPRKWPRYVWSVVGVVAASIANVVGLELWLMNDPLVVPPIMKAADYHPLAITRLLSSDGEIIGETSGARRRLVGPDKMPTALGAAVLAVREPHFLDRPPIGQSEVGHAVWDRLRGRPDVPPLTVQLVRRLAGSPSDGGPLRVAREWLMAMTLERRLTRAELLHIYLNEVPFGGALGAEEGARAKFGKSLGELDSTELRILAEMADRTGTQKAATTPIDHSGCGRLAARKLAERYEPAALARLGADVVTPCEPMLERAIAAAIERAHLEPSGLRIASVVIRLPGQEIAAVVGDTATPRAIGGMRAPFVLGAALASKKWTTISSVEPDGPPLRALAMRSPVDAADGLVNGGLSVPAVTDLASRAGIGSTLEGEGLTHGTATVTPLELASALAMFAEGGQHRLPQVLRSIDGVRESDGARAATLVVPPEVAYLTISLMQPTRTGPPPSAAAIKRASATAWTGLFAPDTVVLVWAGFADGHALEDGDAAARVAAAVGREIVAAAMRGRSNRTFARPRGLIARRVDRTGRLLPLGDSGGVEEWFVPGGVPPEEPRPEEQPERAREE